MQALFLQYATCLEQKSASYWACLGPRMQREKCVLVPPILELTDTTEFLCLRGYVL